MASKSPRKPGVIPRGFRTVTPSLAVADVPDAVEFYTAAFGAERHSGDGRSPEQFVTLKIGTSMVFVTQGWSAMGHMPAAGSHPSAVSQHMYVEDVDAVFAAAIKSGATAISEPAYQYWGERNAVIEDPFGHIWSLATREEILTELEIAERLERLLGKADAAPVEAASSEDA